MTSKTLFSFVLAGSLWLAVPPATAQEKKPDEAKEAGAKAAPKKEIGVNEPGVNRAAPGKDIGINEPGINRAAPKKEIGVNEPGVNRAAPLTVTEEGIEERPTKGKTQKRAADNKGDGGPKLPDRDRMGDKPVPPKKQ
jgi:hypothetical protein